MITIFGQRCPEFPHDCNGMDGRDGVGNDQSKLNGGPQQQMCAIHTGE